MTKKDDIFIKQYEILVDSTIHVTNWRQTANNFYLTVNTVLVSAASFLFSANPNTGCIIGIFGIIIAVLWRVTIIYFGNLNKIKFNMIHKMEKDLPVALFKDEWAELKKKHKWITPTRLERWIPVIFLLAYLFFVGSYLYPVLIMYF